MQIFESDSTVNGVLTTATTMPINFLALMNGNDSQMITTIILTVLLWLLGQGFVFLRWYIDRKRKNEQV